MSVIEGGLNWSTQHLPIILDEEVGHATSRIWFTAKQKAELSERWKNGQCVLAISRVLERRNKMASRGSWPSMEGSFRRHAAEL